jgi:hypothetical protein
MKYGGRHYHKSIKGLLKKPIINIGESSGLRFADHNFVISIIIKDDKSLCACKYILQIG